MFKVNEDDKSIVMTRGDIGVLSISDEPEDGGEQYTFKPGNIVRFSVYVNLKEE